jgi:hypothetical protein
MNDAERPQPQQERPKVSLASVPAVLLIVVLVVGGAWAVSTYTSLEREHQQLTLALRHPHLEQTLRGDILANQSLEIVRLGSERGNQEHLYKVTYYYSFNNVGDRDREISCVELDLHYATLPYTEEYKCMAVNEVGEPGPMNWISLCRKAYIHEPRWERREQFPGMEKPGDVKFVKGLGGTALLRGGDISSGSFSASVKGADRDWITVRLKVYCDGGESWRLSSTKCLGE